MSYQNKEELVATFAQAWRTLNPGLIIENLDESFRYDSQWVLEYLDYHGYIDYIRSKFEAIKNTHSNPQIEVVHDPYEGGSMIKITQYGTQVAYYRIKVKEGKVVKGDMCAF